jgi:hypothetical protein
MYKKWKTYKYEDFNFTVELHEPKLTVKEIPGEGNQMEGSGFILVNDKSYTANNASYMS